VLAKSSYTPLHEEEAAAAVSDYIATISNHVTSADIVHLVASCHYLKAAWPTRHQQE
jgi:hypothetical protein